MRQPKKFESPNPKRVEPERESESISQPEGSPSSSGFCARRLWMLKSAAALPFVVLATVYLLSPPFRSEAHRALGYLSAGDLTALRGWAAAYGIWSPLVTFVLMIAQAIAAPIPAALVTATNSLLFGPFWGAVHSILSANVAALICYGIGRYFRPLIARLVHETTLAKTERFVEEHGVAAVLAARLAPFVPFDPISYVAGMSRLRAWPFFWATLVGQTPAGFAYSYLFQNVSNPARFVVLGASTVAALAVVGWTARRMVRGTAREVPQPGPPNTRSESASD